MVEQLIPEHVYPIRPTAASPPPSPRQIADAEPEYRQVLKLAEKVRGSEHPATLEARYDLAGNLARLGKLPEAKELARRAADSARKTLGPNHPTTQKYTTFLTELETKNSL